MNAPTTKGGEEHFLASEGRRELVIFRVADLVCALDIERAQEIKGQLKIIEVPETQLIEPRAIDEESRIVVVRHEGSVVGLLVDHVDDIVPAHNDELEPPPANVSGVRGEFFDAVYKRPEDLACLLNVPRILAQE